jgi:DNA-binding NtrC family response regulator
MTMKILVVNDERAAANSIAEALRRNGHQTLPLYDAIEAVEHAEHFAFDVAILGTPRSSTWDALASAIRELMPHCKVIRCVERRWAGLMRALDAMQQSEVSTGEQLLLIDALGECSFSLVWASFFCPGLKLQVHPSSLRFPAVHRCSGLGQVNEP